MLTARLASSPRRIEINPDEPSAVAFRKEVATIEPEFACMLDDLVKLARDREGCIRGTGPLDAPAGPADMKRIATAVDAMTAVVNEYAKQRERDTALPKWLTACGILRRSNPVSTHVLCLQPTADWGTSAEFLIGSRRFN